MPRGKWERIAGSRREAIVRSVLSLVAAAGGVTYLVIGITFEPGAWTKFIWPAVYLFVAWRFLRLGLYASDWGVRINNPVLTWWYPWSRVDHFELASTGEMFAPKARAVALVSRRGRQRRAFGLSTSRFFFKMTPEQQAEILYMLNARAARAGRV